VSTPEKKDFHLDLTFTDRPNKLVLPIAIAVAAAGILLIAVTMFTNFAERILPMSDSYLQVLVPRAADGKEALSLVQLDYPTTENTLSVSGSVVNRTDFPITGLLAVVTAQDINNAVQTVEVPLTPAEIISQGTGSFQTTITLGAKPGGYSLRFRLADDGPFVPHRDDRSLTAPVISSPAPPPAPPASPAPPAKK
jgi:hypothetical protein